MMGFDEQLHRRTNLALKIAWISGLIGGTIAAGSSLVIGMAIAGAGAIAALWYTPPAETVAIQWREHERLEERDSQ